MEKERGGKEKRKRARMGSRGKRTVGTEEGT